MDVSVQRQEEFDEQQASAERTGCHLLKDALESVGLNNFENALGAVEEFLADIDLFDPDVAFGEAAEALGAAALAFVIIDRDSDHRLSRAELSQYANHLDGRAKELIEWLLIHYDAIGRAGFFHKTQGISRSDLLRAYGVFKGMEYVHKHFDEIARGLDSCERKTLTHADLDEFVEARCHNLDGHTQRSLNHLTRYLRQLEVTHRGGYSAEEFDELTPEMLGTA
ncbi:MAG: hypothetical protein U0105_13600 [Candidatus Obscuribacterales bacterium]